MATEARQRICLISFSAVYRDGRVLRQIEYLAPHYDLTVVGYGAHPGYDVEWIPVARQNKLDLVKSTLLLAAGRVIPALREYRYWHHRPFAQAFAHLKGRQWDAIYANEWSALPIAVKIAAANQAPILLDNHEFYPLQFEHHTAWRQLYSPMIRYLLKKYSSHISAAVTVCQPIADRYEQEFGFKSSVVLNAPKRVDVPDHDVNPASIQLLHHGNAQYNRQLGIMIEAMPHVDERYHLNFMLVDQEAGCLDGLKQLAARIAPDRVTFLDPVKPTEIVSRIAQFDLGLTMYALLTYNTRMALPNKLFDALNAGLGVVMVNSPSMIKIADDYGCGVTTPYNPRTIAETLNRLTVEDITRMRAASHRAAEEFNADTQLAKVIELFRTLLAQS